MRYVCLSCGHRFELGDDADEKKARCPSCLRVTGIEKVKDTSASPVGRNPWLVPGIAVAALALLGGGYAIWRAQAPARVGEEIAAEPLSHEVLVAHLRRLRVDARAVVDLLRPTEAIEQFASQAAGSGNDREAAAAIYRAVREKASRHAFSRWSLGVPRETPIAPASTVLEWISEDGARRRLYPLEAAALMAAAARARGIDARIAEIWEFPGDRSPPDPSGHFGYYGVAVYEGEGDPQLFDPWGGHEVAPESDSYRVLNDVQAIGAALNIRAIHMLVRENEPVRAMDISGDALRLDARAPVARSVRGAIMIAAGGSSEGVQEFESARQIRDDAPRLQLLAGVRLAQGDLEAARRELALALERSPDYAAAHAALAAIHLSEGEPDLAEEQLRIAQRLDPDLHTLPGLWAGYHASSGDLGAAIASAEQALERNPSDVQTRLLAARIYRQAGRYSEMRRQARTILELSPAGSREQMENVIRQVLGPTALDNPLDDDAEHEDEEVEEEDEDEAALEEEEGSAGALRLESDSPLLGEDDAPAVRLLDEDGESAPAPGEPTLRLREPSRYGLGGGGGGLRLDLSQ